ncbi:MAG: hypothetical protein QXP88_00330 [Thermoproteota archaeon]
MSKDTNENLLVQESVTSNNFPVKLILLVSKSCGFCRELMKRNIETLMELDVYILYKEDRPVEFTTYMQKAKSIIDLQHPELKEHDSITPILLIMNKENDSLLSVVLGFTSIESLLSQLISKNEQKLE